MIALLTTYLIFAYVLIPGVLFRTSASQFLKLRLFGLTKTEEAIFGCFVSSVPFVLAAAAVWYLPVAREHPFELPETAAAEYRVDYRRALTLVVAEDPARFLEAAPPGSRDRNGYVRSLENIGCRQLRFLAWYYPFIVAEGVLFGFLTRKYGEWSEFRAYEWLVRRFFLPRVSEWQILLTDFAFPKQRRREVLADVLCGNRLYRGRVGDYFLNKSGELSGLLLKKVDRFQREYYEEERGRSAIPDDIDREKFWRNIPGANFYVPANQVTNLNLRFPYKNSSDLEEHIRKILRDHGVEGNVSVEFEQPPDPPQMGRQDSRNQPSSDDESPRGAERAPD